MDVPLRAQYGFWTDEMDRPPELLHFSIIDCVAFAYPQMFATTNQQGHRVRGQATICQLSTASSMRLCGKDVTKRNEYATVGKVSDIVARWRHAFPSIRNPDDFENVSLCLRLPVPWVVFIATGKWHAASLPLLCLNERKRSGYHVLSPTLDNEPANACQMGGAPQSSNIDLAAGQSAADCMRRLCRSQALTEFAKQEATGHIVWLQGLVDALHLDKCRQVNTMFLMEDMVNVVTFSGFLHGLDAEGMSMHTALILALRAALPPTAVFISQPANC